MERGSRDAAQRTCVSAPQVCAHADTKAAHHNCRHHCMAMWMELMQLWMTVWMKLMQMSMAVWMELMWVWVRAMSTIATEA